MLDGNTGASPAGVTLLAVQLTRTKETPAHGI